MLAGGQRDHKWTTGPRIVSKNNKLASGFPKSNLNVEFRAAQAFESNLNFELPFRAVVASERSCRRAVGLQRTLQGRLVLNPGRMHCNFATNMQSASKEQRR